MQQMTPAMKTARGRRRVLATAAALALILSGCVSGTDDSSGASSADSAYPVVAVSSFPLLYVVQQVGGDQVEILNLATASGHAHDMELSPSQVNQLGKADLALYLSEGFQPGVETAIQQTGVASLDGFSVLEESQTIAGDPHVWMNPLNIATIAQELSTVLNQANPEAGGYYKQNALELTETMDQIDQEYEAVLAGCRGQTLLTAHEAFGYLAARYDLDQVGVLGVDPEAEPSPARLRQIMTLIKERDIQFLFAEPAGAAHDTAEEDHDHDHEGDEQNEADEADEGAANSGAHVSSGGQKIADTLGISALALDPMEVQTNPSLDVPAVFALNLASLQEGLECATR